YVNGALVATTARTGAIAVSTNQLQIGGDQFYGQNFQGLIDEVRVYNRALTLAEGQNDRITPIGNSAEVEVVPPTIAMTSPANGANVSANVSLSASASDNVAVAGVQFYVDGLPVGAEVPAAPYATVWDASSVTPGAHVIDAVARDFAG